ncbi:HAD family hydrolase [Hwanghaeella grinnelliae]|uniref:phosphoglycolate phosphatase n=1 Tax=Hwanghaeella grinnelliae TaxID=2500179 RepID=A0A3S2Z706_9PROT|nr:HAD hydrolase-like protein [Hwanghaeella grinnelliae]RVU34743.1 HAD family hydrolase [Hwanghaeella grinnelliae]
MDDVTAANGASRPAVLTGPVDVVIFDFDGVVVDSVELKVDAFRDMYRDHGAEVMNAVEAYTRYHGGMSRMKKFAYFEAELIGRPVDQTRIDALCAAYSALVEEKVCTCPLIEGAEAFLERFSGRIPFYVISGTPEAELNRIAERRGVSKYFRRLRGSPMSKEEGIEEFLADGPFSRDRAVMIGDAITDYDAAVATGIGFVGIAPPDIPHFFPDGTRIIPNLVPLAREIGHE